MKPEILADLINEIVVKSTLLSSDKSFVEGLTPRQVHIMMEIGTHVFRHGDLAIRLGVEPSTLTRTLDALVKSGFVDRGPNPYNRREVLVRLSDKGRAAFDHAHHMMKQNCADILHQVPPSRLAQMEESLVLLLGIMKKSRFRHE